VPGTWLVDSDRTLEFDVNTEVDTQLRAIAYNLGAYDHTFYIRWKYTPITLVSAPAQLAQIVVA